MQERAEAGGVALVEPDAPDGIVLGDDPRICKQMLINLLSNAVKFKPSGGRVTVSVTLDDNGDLQIAIADTGIGIAPEDIDRVLQPFVQVDSGLNRKREGTGLGLPLVKAFAELHGGGLSLDSRPGTGTTAKLRFPSARILSLGPARLHGAA